MTDITANNFDLLDRIYDRNVTRFGFLLDFGTNNVYLGLDIALILKMYISHYKLWLMIKREKKKKGHNLLNNLLACYSIIVPLVFTLISTYLPFLCPDQQIVRHRPSFSSTFYFELYRENGLMFV